MDFYLDPFEFPSIKEETRCSFEAYVSAFEASFSRLGPLELDRHPDDIKRDVFLSVAGEPFLEDLEEVISYPEVASYDVILTSFLAKHSSQAFLLQDTLAFRSLSQGEDEALGDYISRVRMKASLLPSECNADQEHSIWVQVLLGLREERLAQEALLGQWTLEELLAQSESLDRVVVTSLAETETRVVKSQNGSYYDQRALEKNKCYNIINNTMRSDSNSSILTLGDAFEQTNVVPRKKMRMEEALRVKGLTIAPQEDGNDKTEDRAGRQSRLVEIYNVLRGGERKEFSCGGCSEGFEDRKRLLRHCERSCKSCNLCFQTKSELHSHNVLAHESARCSICKKLFSSKAALEAHNNTDHGVSEDCPYCGSSFLQGKSLSGHIRRVHLKERRFSCERCGKRFETNGLLQKHISGVHEQKISAICHICSRAFTSVACYRAHVLRVHENVRNFECESCGARFHANTDLMKHKKGVHDKILDYVCEFCRKGFSRNSILQKHIKAIHSNERDFQCGLCSNAYVSKYNLHRHVQEAHERVKQTCGICHKDIAGFGVGNMAKHIKKVHGVPPPASNSILSM